MPKGISRSGSDSQVESIIDTDDTSKQQQGRDSANGGSLSGSSSTSPLHNSAPHPTVPAAKSLPNLQDLDKSAAKGLGEDAKYSTHVSEAVETNQTTIAAAGTAVKAPKAFIVTISEDDEKDNDESIPSLTTEATTEATTEPTTEPTPTAIIKTETPLSIINTFQFDPIIKINETEGTDFKVKLSNQLSHLKDIYDESTIVKTLEFINPELSKRYQELSTQQPSYPNHDISFLLRNEKHENLKQVLKDLIVEIDKFEIPEKEKKEWLSYLNFLLNLENDRHQLNILLNRLRQDSERDVANLLLITAIGYNAIIESTKPPKDPATRETELEKRTRVAKAQMALMELDQVLRWLETVEIPEDKDPTDPLKPHLLAEAFQEAESNKNTSVVKKILFTVFAAGAGAVFAASNYNTFMEDEEGADIPEEAPPNYDEPSYGEGETAPPYTESPSDLSAIPENIELILINSLMWGSTIAAGVVNSANYANSIRQILEEYLKNMLEIAIFTRDGWLSKNDGKKVWITKEEKMLCLLQILAYATGYTALMVAALGPAAIPFAFLSIMMVSKFIIDTQCEHLNNKMIDKLNGLPYLNAFLKWVFGYNENLSMAEKSSAKDSYLWLAKFLFIAVVSCGMGYAMFGKLIGLTGIFLSLLPAAVALPILLPLVVSVFILHTNAPSWLKTLALAACAALLVAALAFGGKELFLTALILAAAVFTVIVIYKMLSNAAIKFTKTWADFKLKRNEIYTTHGKIIGFLTDFFIILPVFALIFLNAISNAVISVSGLDGTIPLSLIDAFFETGLEQTLAFGMYAACGFFSLILGTNSVVCLLNEYLPSIVKEIASGFFNVREAFIPNYNTLLGTSYEKNSAAYTTSLAATLGIFSFLLGAVAAAAYTPFYVVLGSIYKVVTFFIDKSIGDSTQTLARKQRKETTAELIAASRDALPEASAPPPLTRSLSMITPPKPAYTRFKEKMSKISSPVQVLDSFTHFCMKKALAAPDPVSLREPIIS